MLIFQGVHSGKPTWQWKMEPWIKMYFLLNIGDVVPASDFLGKPEGIASLSEPRWVFSSTQMAFMSLWRYVTLIAVAFVSRSIRVTLKQQLPKEVRKHLKRSKCDITWINPKPLKNSSGYLPDEMDLPKMDLPKNENPFKHGLNEFVFYQFWNLDFSFSSFGSNLVKPNELIVGWTQRWHLWCPLRGGTHSAKCAPGSREIVVAWTKWWHWIKPWLCGNFCKTVKHWFNCEGVPKLDFSHSNSLLRSSLDLSNELLCEKSRTDVCFEQMRTCISLISSQQKDWKMHSIYKAIEFSTTMKTTISIPIHLP